VALGLGLMFSVPHMAAPDSSWANGSRWLVVYAQAPEIQALSLCHLDSAGQAVGHALA